MKKRMSRWKDENGNLIPAAGWIPFNSLGIWVIAEKWGKKKYYTDIGGRYRFDDGDIWATIAREFSEETYQSTCLTRDDIISLLPFSRRYLLRDSRGKICYLCCMIPTGQLSLRNKKLDWRKFQERRKEVISTNPHHTFRICELRFLSYEDLLSKRYCLSIRLKKMLPWICSRYPDEFERLATRCAESILE